MSAVGLSNFRDCKHEVCNGLPAGIAGMRYVEREYSKTLVDLKIVLSSSFAIYCKTSCGVSVRYLSAKEFVPLTSCQKDIKSHLKQLNVSQNNVLSEKDLILARAGLFEEHGTGAMTICPKHRSDLGLMWRPTRASKCKHPLHGSKKEGQREEQASKCLKK